MAAALKPTYDAGMKGEFAGSVGDNIEKVYRDLDAKKYLTIESRTPCTVPIEAAPSSWGSPPC